MAPIDNAFMLAESILDNESKADPILSRLTDKYNKEFKNIKKVKFWQFSSDIVWRNIIVFLYLHIGSFYAIYLMVSGNSKFSSFFVVYVYGVFGAFGVTAGAHRLFAHRAYKAKWPLRLILMLCNSVAFQNSLYEWVRDHRVHHKFVDTDADPHNVNRGFFFSHMGWLMIKKHPDVREKGKSIDMSDLEKDPIIMFQKKYYLILMPLMCFVLPTMFPYLYMDESFSNAWYHNLLRYVMSLHCTWFVNSAAHIWGMKPYDKSIKSTDNIFVAFGALGEGWHNYHHVFPWDYKTAELGNYRLNFTTAFIDFFSKIGWAYDLRTVPMDMIRKRAHRTGDGNNSYSNCIDKNLVLEKDNNFNNLLNDERLHLSHDNETLIWGWNDPDMSKEDKNDAFIIK